MKIRFWRQPIPTALTRGGRHFLCILFALALPVVALAQTAPAGPVGGANRAPIVPEGDPIGIAAYGEIFDRSGKRIEPTVEFIRQALDRYIKRLTEAADERVRATLRRHQRTLAEKFQTDEMTPRFLILEYLNNAVQPQDQAYLEVRNHILRKHWYQPLLGFDRFRKQSDRRHNLPKDIAEFGIENGMILKATASAGREYIEECRRANVPIPPQWNGGDWSYKGDLNTNFLNLGNPAEVWRADSTSPKGLCIALPRYYGPVGIGALGIICLGTESNNACFFDAENVGPEEKLNAEDLISGADLSNGVCTDCHAGENPYVTHPGGPLDMAPDNQPAQWHNPLIKPTWPQNPGPFGLLDLIPINPLPPDEDQSCLTCHKQGQFGRFPDVLALNAWKGGESSYCKVILKSAIGNTMPGPGSKHDKHVQAMLAFCGQNPPPPGEVPPPDTDDNPGVVGPPIVIGPLYACAEAVEVSGGIYGAKLTVRIDGADVASATVNEPSQMIIPVPALVAGQVVAALQEKDGTVSAESQPVAVIDHTVNYPNGLPVPEIDPTLIYQCGRTIAVRHVRGAKVTVFTNGSNDVTYTTGGDWTNLPPAVRPFNLGDRYTAQQAMCSDKSGISGQEVAVTPPSPMPVPAIDPDPPIAGQELIHLSNLANGALTTVLESSAGQISQFSTAVDWMPEVDIASGLGHPLQAGEQVAVVSELCEDAKISFPDARPCERLDAPRIAQPLVGNTFVHITRSVPSARVLVYDAGLNEIADGSGTPLGLTRALVVGDVLTVIQKLGKCTSASAYQVAAICASVGGDCG